jgi:hypothetical protein
LNHSIGRISTGFAQGGRFVLSFSNSMVPV